MFEGTERNIREFYPAGAARFWHARLATKMCSFRFGMKEQQCVAIETAIFMTHRDLELAGTVTLVENPDDIANGLAGRLLREAEELHDQRRLNKQILGR